MDEKVSRLEELHPYPDGTGLDDIYVTMGKDISDAAVLELTEKLRLDENDLKSRLKLLGYFWRFQNRPKQAEEFKTHALWMIHNRPEDKICGSAILIFSKKHIHLFSDIKKAWKEAIKSNPENARILGNAGCSLSLLSPKEATQYLEKSVRLDGSNNLFNLFLQSLQEDGLDEK